MIALWTVAGIYAVSIGALAVWLGRSLRKERPAPSRPANVIDLRPRAENPEPGPDADPRSA